MNPTQEAHTELQAAYSRSNQILFKGGIALVTDNASARKEMYPRILFGGPFRALYKGCTTDEIAMYPMRFMTMAEDLGWDETTTWTANGVRAADSPRRRIHIVKGRARNFSSKQFYPVFDMRKADVMVVILSVTEDDCRGFFKHCGYGSTII